MSYVINFTDITLKDVDIVGGKNAYLGDMITHLAAAGVKVPSGYAVTTAAYKLFLQQNNIEANISALIASLDASQLSKIKETSDQIRKWILNATLPAEVVKDITQAYHHLSAAPCQVAVRSSATAEDSPETSFAGQQETFLNIENLDGLLSAIRRVYASLFTERSIAYRLHHGISQKEVAISVGIQKMIRSDLASSGIIFTIDTESGFDQVILISGTYGLGEIIVQGQINPDEFYVHKPLLRQGFNAILSRKAGSKASKMVYSKDNGKNLKIEPVPSNERRQFCITDKEIIILARYALAIEDNYKIPMDIEWAKDGIDGEIYIVQARPETVKSRASKNVIEHYQLVKKGEVLISGRSVGQRIGQGKARIIMNPENKHLIESGDILVTESTNPDWEPIMKRASGIVTNHGGRTCHAAILARELGIPAIVGCHNATDVINENDEITLSCAEGETGYVYQGLLNYEIVKTNIDKLPKLPVKIYMNIANPDQAFTNQFIPNDGVGLARIEFIISNQIGIHPNAIIHYADLSESLRSKIQAITAAYASPTEFYIEKLSEGIAMIAAAFYPKPVIVRFSDFKSNEYEHLLGGELYEKKEENPMLGYRGAYRYITDDFRECFKMECEAIKRIRHIKGLSNLHVMVPFVRTVDEAEQVISLLNSHGLKRGDNGLQFYMMCEVPSNVILAEKFLALFDGFSIGSNDLTQLTLGLDRDSEQVASIFDERDEAVKLFLHQVISTCQKLKKHIGICGQGPSDHLDFAQWLLAEGIESISLNPDSIVSTWIALSK